jgi:glutaredoxin 3
MPFIHQLYTSADAWCSLDALAVAVNAQAGLQAEVTRQGSQLRIVCRQKQRISTAEMLPFDQAAYDALARRAQEHISQRECEAAPQFQRTVVLTTPQEDEAGALCHVAIADALWWLMGGFLADPATGTLWGRNAWRQTRSLRRHAAELLAVSESAVSPLPPPLPAPLPGAALPALSSAQSVTVYTLPYCRHCRTLVQQLKERGIPFQEVDVVRTAGAAEQMLALNNGQRAAPTIRIGSQVLVGPEADELDAALRAIGLL